MKEIPKFITLDGTAYVRADSVSKNPVAAGKAVVVRAHSGVFVGYLDGDATGTSVKLNFCRQVYSWDSTGLPKKSMTCPDLATNGFGSGSKLSEAAPEAVIAQVGAVFYMTASAEESARIQRWGEKA